MPITITQNDITKLQVDALVCPTNINLQMGYGVCATIFKAAGIQEMQSSCNKIAPIRIGDAVITDGFNLLAKYVIHTAVPKYYEEKQGEYQLLRLTYTNSIKCALENNCKSIAFTFMSRGLYAYPKDAEINIAITTIGELIKGKEIDISLVFSKNDSFTGAVNLFDKYDVFFDEHYDNEPLNIDTLWIIGNGFDIASGLKTKYADFIEWYRYLPSINDHIHKFKEKINDDEKGWANLELKLGEITSDYDEDINTFEQCFDDLRQKLNEYLEKESKEHANYSKIDKYFNNITIDTTAFVILNYTQNFENYIRSRYKEKHIFNFFYPHGNIFDNNYANMTVLGVGEPEHIKNPFFRDNEAFKIKFIKVKMTDWYANTDIERLFMDKVLSSQKLLVNVFGCSVGEVDAYFWAHIFKGRSDNDIVFLPEKLYNCWHGIGKQAIHKVVFYNYKLGDTVFTNEEDKSSFDTDYKKLFETNDLDFSKCSSDLRNFYIYVKQRNLCYEDCVKLLAKISLYNQYKIKFLIPTIYRPLLFILKFFPNGGYRQDSMMYNFLDKAFDFVDTVNNKDN